MASDSVLAIRPLAFPWETPDPFLFCAYHLDAYPKGNRRLGPAASLAGRDIGMDFAGLDGWRMYHGDVVPGFPRHPHRGFETVTIARKGYIDHSDSLGAAARFGQGDVQWVTAGRGIVHAEMFPLLNQDAPNPAELFQIWLNLPAASKFVAPHFTMHWSHSVPTVTARDPAGRETSITLIAGSLGEAKAPPPPPQSWAARPDTDVAIWTLKMGPEARWTLPPARPGSNRWVYVFQGGPLHIGERQVPGNSLAVLHAGAAAELRNGGAGSELLLLQGKPIGEPVVQHGPFVMNSRQEILDAFHDYQRDEFGGWPWPSDGPVHPPASGRHARYPDGRVEKAD